MPRDYPRGFKPKLHPHQMREILWWFSLGEGWEPMSALQVGRAMHTANALRCRSCQELVEGGHLPPECPIQSHHFVGECEYCAEDGVYALNELAEKGLVELVGAPTEKAKEMQFELEAAELLDPPKPKRKRVRTEWATT